MRVIQTLAGLSLAAWATLLAGGGTSSISAILCAPADARTGSAMLPLLALASPVGLVAGWALMVAAMMPPLIVQPLLHVCEQSFARRRRRAMLLFGAGYGSVWLAAGLMLQLLAWALKVLPPASPLPLGIATAVLVAFVWQVSPAKQVCLNGCHRQPALAAFGVAAHLDALGFGVGHALWCVGACGPLMLLAASLEADTGFMGAMPMVALFALAERFEPPGPFFWRLRVPLRLSRIAVNWFRQRLVASLVG